MNASFAGGVMLKDLQHTTLLEVLEILIEQILTPEKRNSLWQHLQKAIAPMNTLKATILLIGTLSKENNIPSLLAGLTNIPDEIREHVLHIKNWAENPIEPTLHSIALHSIKFLSDYHPTFDPTRYADIANFMCDLEEAKISDTDIKLLTQIRSLYLEMAIVEDKHYRLNDIFDLGLDLAAGEDEDEVSNPVLFSTSHTMGTEPLNLNKIGPQFTKGEISQIVAEYVTEQLEALPVSEQKEPAPQPFAPIPSPSSQTNVSQTISTGPHIFSGNTSTHIPSPSNTKPHTIKIFCVGEDSDRKKGDFLKKAACDEDEPYGGHTTEFFFVIIENVKFMLQHSLGSERFRTISPANLKGVHAVFIFAEDLKALKSHHETFSKQNHAQQCYFIKMPSNTTDFDAMQSYLTEHNIAVFDFEQNHTPAAIQQFLQQSVYQNNTVLNNTANLTLSL
jgi:hypothetical protein